MIDMNKFRANPQVYADAAAQKRINVDVYHVLQLDAKRRAQQVVVEELRKQRNELTRQAAIHEEKRAEAKALGQRLTAEEENLRAISDEFERAVLFIPGVPAADVPVGITDDDNVEIRRTGTIRAFDFEPFDHVVLLTKHKMVEFEAPRMFAGARAYALIGNGALLEMALMRFAMDVLINRGFTPVAPPVMVRDNAMLGTGYFPIGEENVYRLERDGLNLVGTAEVPLAAMLMDKLLDANELPVRLAGISPCFRREAGAAGRDTKGLYRVHQFQKVEQVVVCENDENIAAALHDELLANAEALLCALELPYRVVAVCTGELGLGQIRKHDIETWMPSRGAYGETHSCSTLGDFQARRLNLKVRTANGDKQYACTLNNTALASPRILIPLLENHQRADGTIHVPERLRPYLNGAAELVPRA